MATEDDLTAITIDYDEALAQAHRIRALRVARAAEHWQQKRIVDATGYSRETIRRLTQEGQEIVKDLCAQGHDEESIRRIAHEGLTLPQSR